MKITNNALSQPVSSTNIYEDEVHLRAIRRYLEGGNAAVMVGSGFSKNAEGGSNVGTWDDLARALAKGLTPDSSPAQEQNLNAANAIQLAEQYERLFSRPALEQLLKEVVPDERLAPSGLHESLLSLSWSEVFTTNYDTLLERAAERLTDTSYITVCCREDIPQSKALSRRRIVKLHGSFASQRPFIVTEEDYRTYPERFAPFVNLVRQALLENILCLIGFSGDDPNFLHWLGWVRDMLDRHALPVYLFLPKAPSLGQRRLLQARGVTPVVLPESYSGESSDFTGRYQRLFDELAKPFEGSPDTWGNVRAEDRVNEPVPGSNSNERYRSFERKLSQFSGLRSTYPGWLVAPDSVRTRLSNSVSSTNFDFSSTEIQKMLAEDSPVFTMAALEFHSWYKSINLEELFEDIASLCITTLEKTNGISYSKLSDAERDRIRMFRINSQRELHDTWKNLAIAALKWARQSHHTEAYARALTILLDEKSRDPSIADAIEYQELIGLVSIGNQIEAKTRVSKWRIKGSDPYMEVRRAMLIAELGDVAGAFSICERAILSLRQQQKHKPNDPLLLSMESWACYMSARLSQTLETLQEFSEFQGASDSSVEPSPRAFDPNTFQTVATSSHRAPEETRPDAPFGKDSLSQRRKRLDERLKTLHTKGYSSSALLSEARAALNRDAGDPHRPEADHPGFDIGSVSARPIFTAGNDGNEKLFAAMAWLQLAEHVGIPPTIGRHRHFVSEFLEAAWWSKYFDSTERRVGILIRCRHDTVLMPRDDSKPRHLSGWLSRYEVATLSPDYATEVAETLIRHIELALVSPTHRKQLQHSLKFYAEAFGRLCARQCDEELVANWGRRLIQVHRSTLMQEIRESWGPISRALARCLAALSPPMQRTLLLESMLLPIAPQQNGKSVDDSNEWVNCIQLFNACEGRPEIEASPALRASMRVWIGRLRNSSTTRTEAQSIYYRLYIASKLDILPTPMRKQIGNVIWKEWGFDNLPIIPGFLQIALWDWPTPDGVSLKQQFLNQLRNRDFRPFSSGGYMRLSIGGRSWSIPGDRSYIDNLKSILNHSSIDCNDALLVARKIESWIKDESQALIDATSIHSGLRDAVIERLGSVDEVLARMWLLFYREIGQDQRELVRIIANITELGQALGGQFLRLRFLFSTIAGIGSAPAFMAHCVNMLGGDLRGSNSEEHVYLALRWIVSRDEPEYKELAGRVLGVLVSGAALRASPTSRWALSVLADLPAKTWIYLANAETFATMDLALEIFWRTLRYGRGQDESGISDAEVPLLRLRCADISCTLLEDPTRDFPGAKLWSSSLESDPLPEIRFARARLAHLGNGLHS